MRYVFLNFFLNLYYVVSMICIIMYVQKEPKLN